MRAYWFFILVLFIPEVEAQSVHRARYHCTTKILKGRMHDGLNTLYFNATRARYVHDQWPKESQTHQQDKIFHSTKGDLEGMPVYMDRTLDTMIWKSDYKGGDRNTYVRSGSIPKINWKLHQDTLIIGGRICHKATGEFGKRQYTAYYDPSIPTSFGPYKFNGLPGLMVWLKSDDGYVEYELMDVQLRAVDDVELHPPKQGTYISEEDFRAMCIESLLRVEALSNEDATVTNNDPPADWEIEKSFHTTYSDFKKARREGKNWNRAGQ